MIFLKKTSWMNSSNQEFLENLYNEFINKKKIDVLDFSFKSEFNELKNNQYNIKNLFKKSYIKDEQYKLNSSESTNIKEKKPTLKKILFCVLDSFFQKNGHKFSSINPLVSNLTKEDLFQQYITSLKKYLKTNYSMLQKKLIKLVLENKIRYELKTYENLYCKSIGFEFLHIDSDFKINWIKNYISRKSIYSEITEKEKKSILKDLIKCEVFEKFLQNKFPGAKRFSLEGADVLIPMLSSVIKSAKNEKISKIVFGMAHRGRLNVLVNILKKPITHIFSEFCDTNKRKKNISGDVKYHLGYKLIKKFEENYNLKLILQCNPSHLEVVNSVVLGTVRASLDKNKKKNNVKNILPILIHGDAAICGQGIVQEVLNMSKTTGYNVNGSIHIVINNQIGFTTSNSMDLRSSRYCTDIAKMTQCPIFHVNADDPEAVIYVTKLALQFRNTFNSDVFIDLVCYRRNGHNEADDPYVTQPVLYKKIKNHPTVYSIFSTNLIKNKIITKEEVNNKVKEYRNKIENEYFLYIKEKEINVKDDFLKEKKNNDDVLEKKVMNANYLKQIANSAYLFPDNFNAHFLVNKIYSNRLKMVKNKLKFDWGAAEVLAYATLIKSGISCRISGQDVSRGTFFHRHLKIHDQKNGSSYIPLMKMNGFSSFFDVVDSVLSEEAALGFEYGYSIASSNTLTIWEAQFGDFANGAQVIIDQFIVSGEQKWNIKSNLVLFLPHGYEGQGPEHSSSRIERFLQLCAQNNICVCIPSSASQMYHLIRKQAFLTKKKPLIIITPKSLLRRQETYSSFDEICYQHFKKIIYSKEILENKVIKRIIFCTGKIFYDLLEKIKEKNIVNICVINVEQLYPFPKKDIQQVLNICHHIYDFVWCQEEPLNQGAWSFFQENIKLLLPVKSNIICISRKKSASPAVGSFSCHKIEQENILQKAININ
ncbi:2-oxoglutarate dehydrogenase E1 component [Buchnera aphidicola]|uniref:oxoglutarate dehydrogenase (succinyl-transferring) n=1 Tax=Buchnera aphidicola (Anoecia oenotherae) TaxID=1241833 RepID=A0A4D6Y0H8_9GAMM|nr:2-oxoglutarate dehydrogenase E1 component [Buchnera aphidicola]QCI19361.1 2-oxoglutarate dehydrogenase E1 component [Buchnera aphidicola (Anoecia oenotherae)]